MQSQGTMIRLRDVWLGRNCGGVLGVADRFFSASERPHRLRGRPLCLPSNGRWSLLGGGGREGVKWGTAAGAWSKPLTPSSAVRCALNCNSSLPHVVITNKLTNYVEQNPFWEAKRFSASQEISHILWNPKVHYRLHKSPPPVHILSQINPVHAHHPTSWRSILILSSHLRLGLPRGSFPQVFPTRNLYASLSPIRATCTSHLIFIDLFTRIMFGERYRSLSSPLCCFRHFPVYLVPLRLHAIMYCLTFWRMNYFFNFSTSCI